MILNNFLQCVNLILTIIRKILIHLKNLAIVKKNLRITLVKCKMNSMISKKSVNPSSNLTKIYKDGINIYLKMQVLNKIKCLVI